MCEDLLKLPVGGSILPFPISFKTLEGFYRSPRECYISIFIMEMERNDPER